MRVIFMGRTPVASVALRHLVDRGLEIAAVVAPTHPAEPIQREFARPLLRNTALELGLPLVSDEALYRALDAGRAQDNSNAELGSVDLVVSFLFWKKIRPALIALPAVGCFNFHPGPLPDFRGRRGYNFAILEGCEEYGATIHWVAEAFDTGDIVEVRRFPISPRETAFSLQRKTVAVLLQMFDDFVDRRLAGEPVPRVPQGPGKSATKRELVEASRIRPDDTPDVIARKVRAFWYPPRQGATIEIGGKHYTLVDDETLNTLGRYLHGSREEPF